MNIQKEIRPMTNSEAKEILQRAHNNDLLCICGGLFEEKDIYDCMQALCMATLALDYAPEMLEVMHKLVEERKNNIQTVI